MTFAEQLRDIQSRAAHSNEPGRILAELAGVIADDDEQRALEISEFNTLIQTLNGEMMAAKAKIAELLATAPVSA